MTQHDPYRTPAAPVDTRSKAPLAALDFVALAAVAVQCIATIAFVPALLAMLREGQLSLFMLLPLGLATLVLVLAGLCLLLRNRAAPFLFIVAALCVGLSLWMPWHIWLPYGAVGVAVLGIVAGFMQWRLARR